MKFGMRFSTIELHGVGVHVSVFVLSLIMYIYSENKNDKFVVTVEPSLPNWGIIQWKRVFCQLTPWFADSEKWPFLSKQHAYI